MIKSCCESLSRCFKNLFSSSSMVERVVDLSEEYSLKDQKNFYNLNKSSNIIVDKQKFHFRDTCQKIIELFNFKIDISNKLSTTFEIKDYVEYKITISIKIKSSLEIENKNALFNISLNIEDGKFKKKCSPVILDAIYNYINKVKSEIQIKKDIKFLKENIGGLIINGKVSIIYLENTVIFRIDIKHPDELIKSLDILEIKIEFKNPKIKNAIDIGKKIYNKFPNKESLIEKDIIIAFLIIVFIMIIYYKINNSEKFLYDLNKTIEENGKKGNDLDNYYTSSSSNYN